MCRPTVDEVPGAAARRSGGRRLEIRAFYLRLSSLPAAELALVYLPSIGGAALELNGRKLPAASPAAVPLARGHSGVYASADRVSAGEGARFEVYVGEKKAAEGVFLRRRDGGGGWRVECRRLPAAAAAVAEVAVVAEGGAVVMKEKVRGRRRGFGCGTLEEIPEEAGAVGWGCECGMCGEEWEVVGEEAEEEAEAEVEAVGRAVEVGIWAVCVGVGLLVSAATARRLRQRRIFW